MLFGQTITKVLKNASKKAPAFFESSYHIRTYASVLASPDLFTSNTRQQNRSQGNSGHSFPNYLHGLYSALLIDPYYTPTLYHNLQGHEERRLVGASPPPPLHSITARTPLHHNKLSAPQIPQKTLSKEPPQKTQPKAQSEPQQQSRHTYDSALKKKHLAFLASALRLDNLDPTLANLLKALRDAIANDTPERVLAIFQAVLRNNLRVPIEVYNIVLYATFVRDISQTIEARMTLVLLIYQDALEAGLRPSVETYEVVLLALLEGAFDSLELHLLQEGRERYIDDDGVEALQLVGDGSHYFALAMELFLACNARKVHAFHGRVYDLLVLGLGVFDHRFSLAQGALRARELLGESALYHVSALRGAASASEATAAYDAYRTSLQRSGALLAAQHDVYGMLVYTLCAKGQFNMATATLDDVLVKAGGKGTQKKGLERAVGMYLVGLVRGGGGVSRGVGLYRKFVAKGILGDEVGGEFLVNAVIMACEDGDIEGAQEAFTLLEKVAERQPESCPGSPASASSKTSATSVSSDESSLFEAVLERDTKPHTPLSPSDLLFLLVTRRSESSPNTFPKAVLMFVSLCCERGVNVERLVRKYVRLLSPESVAHVMMCSEGLSFELLETCQEPNRVLSLAIQDARLGAHIHANLQELVESAGFWRCVREFSLKTYVRTIGVENVAGGFFGLMWVWMAYWSAGGVRDTPLETMMRGEFDDVDNVILRDRLLRSQGDGEGGAIALLRNFYDKLSEGHTEFYGPEEGSLSEAVNDANMDIFEER